jgi:hypothetical protein
LRVAVRRAQSPARAGHDHRADRRPSRPGWYGVRTITTPTPCRVGTCHSASG